MTTHVSCSSNRWKTTGLGIQKIVRFGADVPLPCGQGVMRGADVNVPLPTSIVVLLCRELIDVNCHPTKMCRV